MWLDILVTVIALLVLGGAITSIVLQKKKGAKCIGCPVEGGCSGKCSYQNKE